MVELRIASKPDADKARKAFEKRIFLTEYAQAKLSYDDTDPLS